jgi:hypothetical protein
MTIRPFVELFTVAYNMALDGEPGTLLCARQGGSLEGEVFEGTLPAGRLVSAVQPNDSQVWLTYYRCTWNGNAVLLAQPEQHGVPNDVLADLRARYADLHGRPDPAHLMPDDLFTVRSLRRMYEVILGEPLMKDTFRRRVIPFLRGTGRFHIELGRPAELFELIAEEG